MSLREYMNKYLKIFGDSLAVIELAEAECLPPVLHVSNIALLMYPDSKKNQELLAFTLKELIYQRKLPAITFEEFKQLIADHESWGGTAEHVNIKAEGELPAITLNSLAYADSDLLPNDVMVNLDEQLMYVVHRNDMKRWLKSENDWPLPEDNLLSRWWAGDQEENKNVEIDVVPPINEDYCFELEKDYWRVSFNGRVYTIKQLKGMQYIIHLIQRAYDDEKEIHISDLYYLVQKRPAVQYTVLSRMTEEQISELGIEVSGLGEGLDLMTPEGKEWAIRKINELRIRIENAYEDGKDTKAQELRETKEALEDHMKKALGFSNRHRKSLDPNERIRKSVSKAISYALGKLGKNDDPPDELALYLDGHLKISSFCSFRKDPKISWKIKKN